MFPIMQYCFHISATASRHHKIVFGQGLSRQVGVFYGVAANLI